MDRLVAYISHPLGEDGYNGPMRDNIANVGEWIKFFVETTRYVILCPWYVYAITHNEAIHAPRRLIDSLTAIERCDVLIQCGGVHNPHMRYEAKAAVRVGTPIADLTSFGVLPPDPTEDTATLIVNRVERSVLRQPRRVWLPLLTTEDIELLKRARHALYTHLPGEHDAATLLLDRILSAAHEEVTDREAHNDDDD